MTVTRSVVQLPSPVSADGVGHGVSGEMLCVAVAVHDGSPPTSHPIHTPPVYHTQSREASGTITTYNNATTKHTLSIQTHTPIHTLSGSLTGGPSLMAHPRSHSSVPSLTRADERPALPLNTGMPSLHVGLWAQRGRLKSSARKCTRDKTMSGALPFKMVGKI